MKRIAFTRRRGFSVACGLACGLFGGMLWVASADTDSGVAPDAPTLVTAEKVAEEMVRLGQRWKELHADPAARAALLAEIGDAAFQRADAAARGFLYALAPSLTVQDMKGVLDTVRTDMSLTPSDTLALDVFWRWYPTFTAAEPLDMSGPAAVSVLHGRQPNRWPSVLSAMNDSRINLDSRLYAMQVHLQGSKVVAPWNEYSQAMLSFFKADGEEAVERWLLDVIAPSWPDRGVALWGQLMSRWGVDDKGVKVPEHLRPSFEKWLARSRAARPKGEPGPDPVPVEGK